MKLKRLLAAILAAATLLAAMALPAAAATAAGFTDISDPAVAEAAELLRLLGVVEGNGSGLYDPNGNLTRAQFCKMAILIRGEGALADAQKNRTIFTDVKGGHWARGYINYASSIVVSGSGANAERLVAGRGGGSFEPDALIACSEAVTMAMRLLGYAAADLPSGAEWYDGYMSGADDLGLLNGLSLAPKAPITRGQAAVLFRNLIFASTKGGGSFMSALGCSVTEPSILLSVSTNREERIVTTAAGAYQTGHPSLDTALAGRRVTLMLNKAGKVLAINADDTDGGSYRTVTVADAEADAIVAAGGERIPVSGTAVVYDKGERTTYAAARTGVSGGSAMTLRYDAAGKLEYIFIALPAEPGQAGVTRTMTVAAAEPGFLVTSTGEQVLVSSSTAVYTADGATTTYSQAYSALAYGDELILGYTLAGSLSYIQAVKPDAPTGEGSYRTLTVAEAEAAYVITDSGERVTLPRDAVVYDGGTKTTYNNIYLDLRAGSRMRLCYDGAGKLQYIFLTRLTKAEQALVVKSTAAADPFAALTGGDTGYTILKNGVAAAATDLRQYDVATYDKATKTLSLSDLRLTGVYLSASPSPKSPETINVLGASFPVLPGAIADLASFQVGDSLTILLTADGQVAGAVSPETARSTAVGVVTACSATQATVTSLNLKDGSGSPVVFQGAVSYSSDAVAARMQGRMVTVSSAKQNELSLSTLSGVTVNGDLDVEKRTLGTAALAPNAILYERVGAGAPQAIRWEQLTQNTVSASHIAYVSTDYAGRVNILVLDSVTGDGFTYGYAAVEQTATDYFNGEAVMNNCITVGSTGPLVMGGIAVKTGDIVGVAASLEKVGSVSRLAGWTALTAVKNVSRAAFTLNAEADGKSPIGTVTTPELVIPIAADVVCYNGATKQPFASLDEARAYSSTLTIYYDRAPEEGGKVRVVVAE